MGEAHVGDTTIVIVESAAVVAGDQVVVSAGTVQAEIVTVVGFGSCAAHRCTVNLQTALHQDHAAGAAVTALHKNYYGLCVGLIPKDKVQKLPLKPILPPLPKVTYQLDTVSTSIQKASWAPMRRIVMKQFLAEWRLVSIYGPSKRA